MGYGECAKAGQSLDGGVKEDGDDTGAGRPTGGQDSSGPGTQREPGHEDRDDDGKDGAVDPERSEGQPHPHQLVGKAAKTGNKKKNREQKKERMGVKTVFF